MEITLVDGIKDGHKYELVLVDGKETPMYVASRLLTNTDRERGLGIFNGGNTWCHLPTNELAGMPPRLGACLYTKSREACGRVTLLPD
jgi:hypothetical protein